MMQINSRVSDAVYFLMTFNAAIFLNIKLEPTMTMSRGLHNPDIMVEPYKMKSPCCVLD